MVGLKGWLGWLVAVGAGGGRRGSGELQGRRAAAGLQRRESEAARDAALH